MPLPDLVTASLAVSDINRQYPCKLDLLRGIQDFFYCRINFKSISLVSTGTVVIWIFLQPFFQVSGISKILAMAHISAKKHQRRAVDFFL